MNSARSKGLVLMWVIVLLGLIAASLMVLTDGANTLLYQADAAQGRAVERNMTASALAWAQVQTTGQAAPPTGETITLDSAQVGDDRTVLTVEFTRLEGSLADVEIGTLFVKGRHRSEQSQKYAISQP